MYLNYYEDEQILMCEAQGESHFVHGFGYKKKPVKCRYRRFVYFTLIELLIVISIISILASMLLPVLKKAKERGIVMSCKGNMKQAAYAFCYYADDYDGWYPGWQLKDPQGLAYYQYYLRPYLTGNTGVWTPKDHEATYRILCCPTVERTIWSSSFPDYYRYGQNDNNEGTGGKFAINRFTCFEYGRKRTQFKDISTKVILGEGSLTYSSFWDNTVTSYLDLTRHGKTSNFLFLDGHAEDRFYLKPPSAKDCLPWE